jgi:hypothetical protein
MEQLPWESDDQLRKHRQHTYNHRAYLKRKKQMHVKKGAPELRRPTSVASLPADNPTMQGLEILLSKYTKTHPKNWPLLFQKSRDFCLLNVSYWIINESGLIKESNPKCASITLAPSTKILPSAKIRRHFAVQFLDPTVKEWCDLFFIKPSTLVAPGGVRQTAGYGLFSARPFKCGDQIAVYIGEIFDLNKFPSHKRTCYSLIFNINKTVAPLKVRQVSHPKMFILDARYCPKDSPDNMKRPPVYFGIHYINNPKWQPDGKQQPNRLTGQTIYPDYNIEIRNDLVATTISDIEVGEELFWDYTDGSGTRYDT